MIDNAVLSFGAENIICALHVLNAVHVMNLLFFHADIDQVEEKQSTSVRRNGGSVVLGDRSTRTVSEEVNGFNITYLI